MNKAIVNLSHNFHTCRECGATLPAGSPKQCFQCYLARVLTTYVTHPTSQPLTTEKIRESISLFMAFARRIGMAEAPEIWPPLFMRRTEGGVQ